MMTYVYVYTYVYIKQHIFMVEYLCVNNESGHLMQFAIL